MKQVTTVSAVFQSTLPRGERHHMGSYIQTDDVFQSTLPRGERPYPFAAFQERQVFQSTLPRGERRRSTGYRKW